VQCKAVLALPTEIRYSQCSISGKFSTGVRLNVTLEQLLYGDITPKNIELIEVVWYEGARWCLNGHRRLYLFKLVRELKPDIIPTVPVIVKDIIRSEDRKAIHERTKKYHQ